VVLVHGFQCRADAGVTQCLNVRVHMEDSGVPPAHLPVRAYEYALPPPPGLTPEACTRHYSSRGTCTFQQLKCVPTRLILEIKKYYHGYIQQAPACDVWLDSHLSQPGPTTLPISKFFPCSVPEYHTPYSLL
jgi:hypothetical protein